MNCMSHEAEKTINVTKRSNGLAHPPEPVVCDALEIRQVAIEWLAGDGSDRCYYRLKSPELNESLVLMQLSAADATALQLDEYDWTVIGHILLSAGITAPKLIKTLPNYAALIIEDYGDLMLETAINDHVKLRAGLPVAELYKQCADIVGKFLQIQSDLSAPWCKRGFNQERFIWEMNFFMEHYIEATGNIHFSTAEKSRFAEESTTLSAYLGSFSNWFVHRDFHSRNIMVKNGQLAVIDFQDARLGPCSYDLVSLCFDAYVHLDNALRMELLDCGINSIGNKLGTKIAEEIIMQWKPMLLQRQLKAIGSFGYLTLHKKKGDYLRYVSRALETLELASLFDERWPFLSKTLLDRMRDRL